MRYGILDVETTIFQKGSPFASRNRLCLAGFRVDNVNHIFDIEYSHKPYGAELERLAELVASVDVIVGFNLKFDLSWLQRYGIVLHTDQKVFDCQVAEFVLTNQQSTYPSLDGCLEKYRLGSKLHTVEEEYWNLGIDTPDVPEDLLTEYLITDLEKTDALYQLFISTIPSSKRNLVNLCNEDLRVLQEMEFNGILFDWDGIKRANEGLEAEFEECRKSLGEYTDHWPHFKPTSGDHLSALLYGGEITAKYVLEQRTDKSGNVRNRWAKESKIFPRLVEPLAGTELAKPGFWSTDKTVISRLPKPRKLIKILMRLADLEHLRSTYYEGLEKLKTKMDWVDGFVHGLLNQCVVITGRLSSSGPNQQNFDGRIKRFIVSRY